MRWVCIVMLALFAAPAMSQSSGTITADEWAAYQKQFVTDGGRVVDDANGGISHSEGQGYGMLLAYFAGDRPAFERLWTFTKTELLLRDDGLAAWTWSPDASPHITDLNNASDGDLLIAYALALAGDFWSEASFTADAARIADAIGTTSIHKSQGDVLLKPGVHGFGRDDRDDGPVVNLSYWIFEALPVMARLAPQHDWTGLAASGKAIIARAMSSVKGELPPDWLSLRRAPATAKGFDPDFGYNALRIPLYLVRETGGDTELLRQIGAAMTGEGGSLKLVNVDSGAVTEELRDPGYRAITALTQCAVDGTAIPAELMTFTPTNYYPSTLHLLALAHVREGSLRCG